MGEFLCIHLNYFSFSANEARRLTLWLLPLDIIIRLECRIPRVSQKQKRAGRSVYSIRSGIKSPRDMRKRYPIPIHDTKSLG